MVTVGIVSLGSKQSSPVEGGAIEGAPCPPINTTTHARAHTPPPPPRPHAHICYTNRTTHTLPHTHVSLPSAIHSPLGKPRTRSTVAGSTKN